MQSRAMISAQFLTAPARSLLDGDGVRLRAMAAEETIADRVVPVRFEACRKVVKGPRLVEEIVFDDSILVARSSGVEAHLQVLIIDLDVVEREFRIREDADGTRDDIRVAYLHVP